MYSGGHEASPDLPLRGVAALRQRHPGTHVDGAARPRAAREPRHGGRLAGPGRPGVLADRCVRGRHPPGRNGVAAVKVYVAMICDRHAEPEAFVFSTAEAIAYAQAQAYAFARSTSDVEEEV